MCDVRRASGVVAVLLLAGLWGMPVAALTPAQQCQAAKLKETGKYGLCRLKAEARAVKTGAALDAATCDLKLAAKWAAAEDKAGGACPTSGDQQGAQGFVTLHTDAVASVLAGEGFPEDCEDQVATCEADLEQCSAERQTTAANLMTCEAEVGVCQAQVATLTNDLYACNGDLASTTSNLTFCNAVFATCSSAHAVCEASLDACADDLATCAAQPLAQRLRTGQVHCSDATGLPIGCLTTGQDGDLQRGVTIDHADNGDGTVTDLRTGLMWEKLGNDGGVHDRDDTYAWSAAFTGKIAALNAAAFAGHVDWRLPNVNELQSLTHFGAANPAVFAAFDDACTPGCAATICSCTPVGGHWSSTNQHGGPAAAWAVDFASGAVVASDKDGTALAVRAVRGGGS